MIKIKKKDEIFIWVDPYTHLRTHNLILVVSGEEGGQIPASILLQFLFK